MAAAYPWSTAPSPSRRAPDWRSASHLSSACCASRTASRTRTSLAGAGVEASAAKDAIVPDGGFDLLEGRVSHEDLERDYDRARGHRLRSLGEARVGYQHLGVGGDRVDGEVLDRHVVLLQPLTHLAGHHDAAAHPRIAGDDHGADVLAVDLRHDGYAAVGAVAGSAGAASATGCSARPKPSRNEATANETADATTMAASTPMYPSLGVTAM